MSGPSWSPVPSYFVGELLAASGSEGPKIQRYDAQEVVQNLELGVHVYRTLNNLARHCTAIYSELFPAATLIGFPMDA